MFLVKTFFYFSGSQFDIHAGDIDQKWPYRDNEIDQFALNYMNKSWVKYFVYINGVTIDGRQMTPSSNNIISIEQAIEKFSSGKIRLLFLLHLVKKGELQI
jgi:cysteinyl-tRNA synthetase